MAMRDDKTIAENLRSFRTHGIAKEHSNL